MNKVEFEKVMNTAGFTVYWSRTNDPKWVRGFVQKVNEQGTPCRYGRASFHTGNFYNLKLYGRPDTHSELTESDYLAFALNHYQLTCEFLSIESYKAIVEEAKSLQAKDLERKLKNRAEIEAKEALTLKPKNGKQKNKKRSKITGRCVRRFIEEIILNKVSK
ncbi:hypothetical protein NVP1205O_57 [Vibrio phage 1.205.O._10N.222.51.A7]|nr:hypothetical protein NVP1205O_57 [Vibrio phage 1.205.O._10N.222.51.A7]